MFDQPKRNGFHLPESPRITSLLAGLMGSPAAPTPVIEATPTPVIEATPTPVAIVVKAEQFEPLPAHTPRSAAARPVADFFASISWAYVPSAPSMVVVTPGMPVREFFAQVNWPGLVTHSLRDVDTLAIPPSVEGFMSQCSWD